MDAQSCISPVNDDYTTGFHSKALFISSLLPDSISPCYKFPELFSGINKRSYFTNGINIADYLKKKKKSFPVAMFG